MPRIGIDIRPKRSQNVDGVFRIVHRICDLGVAKPETFSNFEKFFCKIIVPVDPTGAIGRKIRFAHSM